MDYSLALEFSYSEFTYELLGNTYSGLNWTDPVETKPTDAELIQAYADWEANETATEYLRQREEALLTTIAVNTFATTLYANIQSRIIDGHEVSQTELAFLDAVDDIDELYPAPE